MDMYPVAINIDNIVQEMEGVEYINVNEYINIDKENNDNLTIEAEDIPKDIKFDTWDEVDSYFDDYVCEFSGKYKSKKSVKAASKGIQRNTKTKKSNCLWHINLTFPEQATQIGVTTFVNQHNHELVPKTQEFSPKYRAFTNEALNEILLMTKYGSLTLTAQRNLLKARFPDLHFQDQDLANVIHKYKIADKINNDASALLTTLMQKKAEDLRWMSPDQVDLWLRYHDVVINDNTARTNQYQMPLGVFIIIDNKCKSRLVCQVLVSDETLNTHVWILECIKKATETAPIVMFTDADPALDAAIPIVFPETYLAHCIFHIAQNLPKNLKAKLGEKWDDFIKQFYQCRNSLCEPLFKQRWNQLLIDYPMAKDHLLRTLDQNSRSWARAYLHKIFTAGIESTARVEGYNWIIKQQLKANSNLCEIADRLDSRLKDEERWNQFYKYKQATTTNTSSVAGQDLFPIVTKILDK
ncbi:hypothetical protein RirG_230330 [Rhizophagus irregularis DAOM 197198w]|uniref:MULE transposase domain-containing protein n=1 Tax=Rhizophagus irregularis (strain DAOM 197198w) TaxID=1432141 RepID=A0A015JIY5_RHIIW|nr:hypothetical protein RirG_230330 [Rhizophagus irregularis DAOM 197198w]